MGMEAVTTVRAPSSLRLDVADLLRRPGTSEPASFSVHLEGLRLELIAVPGDVHADLRLDALVDGIAVSGTIDGVAEGECARCLAPVQAVVHADVEEAFTEDATDDETYPIEYGAIDLEPMVRDAVLLAMPLNPLCRPDCAGLCPVCGEDRNRVDCGHQSTPTDPRWDALRALGDTTDGTPED